MYLLIPPTTGGEGGLQLTVKDEGGPELENMITTGPGAEGMTVQTQNKRYLLRAYSRTTLIEFRNKEQWTQLRTCVQLYW